jgi:hypothetical protein
MKRTTEPVDKKYWNPEVIEPPDQAREITSGHMKKYNENPLLSRGLGQMPAKVCCNSLVILATIVQDCLIGVEACVYLFATCKQGDDQPGSVFTMVTKW